MIQFKLRQLVAQKEFAERRNVMLKEVCAATGVHRSTLNRMVNHKPHNVGCETINLLCQYFGCTVSDLMEYVPDPAPASRVSKKGQRRVPRKTKSA